MVSCREAAGTRKPGPKRPEKLDPFKDYIAERMQAAAPDAPPAAVFLREMQARGYDGGDPLDLAVSICDEDGALRGHDQPACLMCRPP